MKMSRSVLLVVMVVAVAAVFVVALSARDSDDAWAEPSGAESTPTPCPTDTVSVGTHCKPVTPTPRPTVDPSVEWTIEIEPEKPRVGDEVKVTAFALGPGGIPAYTLDLDPNDGDAPLLLTSERQIPLSQLGIPVSWELDAFAVGDVTLRLSVNYEVIDCPDDSGLGCLFYFTTQSAPPIELSVNAAWGDANCSNAVDAIDAAVVLQRVAELIASLGCEDAADVNADGTVGATDAALVLQYLAGLIPSLGP